MNPDISAPAILLSHFQAAVLLQARKSGQPAVTVSLDLGLTTAALSISQAGVRFPTEVFLDWPAIETIQASEAGCFAVETTGLRKIQVFSEQTAQVYTLMPTRGAPTMLISGLPMHRIKDVDPYQDTILKIKAIKPVMGQVLDTATGLGYTAIQAAKTAEQVTTIEISPASLEIARQNPWSQALFGNPKITQICGDASEEIEKFQEAFFSRIIHDPPMFSLAGELYSAEFYRQLWRVLRWKGRVFHYIGDLDSKSGRVVAGGATRRLQLAGFSRIERHPEAFGLVGFK